jgi:hypothetical protein
VMSLSGVAARLLEAGFRPAHADLAASLRDFLRQLDATAAAQALR